MRKPSSSSLSKQTLVISPSKASYSISSSSSSSASSSSSTSSSPSSATSSLIFPLSTLTRSKKRYLTSASSYTPTRITRSSIQSNKSNKSNKGNKSNKSSKKNAQSNRPKQILALSIPNSSNATLKPTRSKKAPLSSLTFRTPSNFTTTNVDTSSSLFHRSFSFQPPRSLPTSPISFSSNSSSSSSSFSPKVSPSSKKTRRRSDSNLFIKSHDLTSIHFSPLQPKNYLLGSPSSLTKKLLPFSTTRTSSSPSSPQSHHRLMVSSSAPLSRSSPSSEVSTRLRSFSSSPSSSSSSMSPSSSSSHRPSSSTSSPSRHPLPIYPLPSTHRSFTSLVSLPSSTSTPSLSGFSTPKKSNSVYKDRADRFIPDRSREDSSMRYRLSILDTEPDFTSNSFYGKKKRTFPFQDSEPSTPSVSSSSSPPSIHQERKNALFYRRILQNELFSKHLIPEPSLKPTRRILFFTPPSSSTSSVSSFSASSSSLSSSSSSLTSSSSSSLLSSSNSLSSSSTPTLFPPLLSPSILSTTPPSPSPSLSSHTSMTNPFYDTGPLEAATRHLVASTRTLESQVSKFPYRVLDAPDLVDDFYLNLLDWSAQNMVGVGLGSSVYLWNSHSCQVTKLLQLPSSNDMVTSLRWNRRGDTLAVGTKSGQVQLWDYQHHHLIRTFHVHESRVGALAWTPPHMDALTSGSRDRALCHLDPKSPHLIFKSLDHKQEVCGLQWHPSEPKLASGGNDNRILIWESPWFQRPRFTYTEHQAGIKALAWSPHERGILVSGGGTQDRSLRVWDTFQPTLHSKMSILTSSQICNVLWSPHDPNRLLSTHGFTHPEIALWSYPEFSNLTNLTGHSHRVLYAALSPNGEDLCTGSGDGTLRFWHVFPNSSSSSLSSSMTSSVLSSPSSHSMHGPLSVISSKLGSSSASSSFHFTQGSRHSNTSSYGRMANSATTSSNGFDSQYLRYRHYR